VHKRAWERRREAAKRGRQAGGRLHVEDCMHLQAKTPSLTSCTAWPCSAHRRVGSAGPGVWHKAAGTSSPPRDQAHCCAPAVLQSADERHCEGRPQSAERQLSSADTGLYAQSRHCTLAVASAPLSTHCSLKVMAYMLRTLAGQCQSASTAAPANAATPLCSAGTMRCTARNAILQLLRLARPAWRQGTCASAITLSTRVYPF